MLKKFNFDKNLNESMKRNISQASSKDVIDSGDKIFNPADTLKELLFKIPFDEKKCYWGQRSINLSEPESIGKTQKERLENSKFTFHKKGKNTIYHIPNIEIYYDYDTHKPIGIDARISKYKLLKSGNYSYIKNLNLKYKIEELPNDIIFNIFNFVKENFSSYINESVNTAVKKVSKSDIQNNADEIFNFFWQAQNYFQTAIDHRTKEIQKDEYWEWRIYDTDEDETPRTRIKHLFSLLRTYIIDKNLEVCLGYKMLFRWVESEKIDIEIYDETFGGDFLYSITPNPSKETGCNCTFEEFQSIILEIMEAGLKYDLAELNESVRRNISKATNQDIEKNTELSVDDAINLYFEKYGDEIDFFEMVKRKLGNRLYDDFLDEPESCIYYYIDENTRWMLKRFFTVKFQGEKIRMLEVEHQSFAKSGRLITKLQGIKYSQLDDDVKHKIVELLTFLTNNVNESIKTNIQKASSKDIEKQADTFSDPITMLQNMVKKLFKGRAREVGSNTWIDLSNSSDGRITNYYIEKDKPFTYQEKNFIYQAKRIQSCSNWERNEVVAATLEFKKYRITKTGKYSYINNFSYDIYSIDYPNHTELDKIPTEIIFNIIRWLEKNYSKQLNESVGTNIKKSSVETINKDADFFINPLDRIKEYMDKHCQEEAIWSHTIHFRNASTNNNLDFKKTKSNKFIWKAEAIVKRFNPDFYGCIATRYKNVNNNLYFSDQKTISLEKIPKPILVEILQILEERDKEMKKYMSESVGNNINKSNKESIIKKADENILIDEDIQRMIQEYGKNIGVSLHNGNNMMWALNLTDLRNRHECYNLNLPEFEKDEQRCIITALIFNIPPSYIKPPYLTFNYQVVGNGMRYEQDFNELDLSVKKEIVDTINTIINSPIDESVKTNIQKATDRDITTNADNAFLPTKNQILSSLRNTAHQNGFDDDYLDNDDVCGLRDEGNTIEFAISLDDSETEDRSSIDLLLYEKDDDEWVIHNFTLTLFRREDYSPDESNDSYTLRFNFKFGQTLDFGALKRIKQIFNKVLEKADECGAYYSEQIDEMGIYDDLHIDAQKVYQEWKVEETKFAKDHEGMDYEEGYGWIGPDDEYDEDV